MASNSPRPFPGRSPHLQRRPSPTARTLPALANHLLRLADILLRHVLHVCSGPPSPGRCVYLQTPGGRAGSSSSKVDDRVRSGPPANGQSPCSHFSQRQFFGLDGPCAMLWISVGGEGEERGGRDELGLGSVELNTSSIGVRSSSSTEKRQHHSVHREIQWNLDRSGTCSAISSAVIEASRLRRKEGGAVQAGHLLPAPSPFD